jgi:hypothetical protein
VQAQAVAWISKKVAKKNGGATVPNSGGLLKALSQPKTEARLKKESMLCGS